MTELNNIKNEEFNKIYENYIDGQYIIQPKVVEDIYYYTINFHFTFITYSYINRN